MRDKAFPGNVHIEHWTYVLILHPTCTHVHMCVYSMHTTIEFLHASSQNHPETNNSESAISLLFGFLVASKYAVFPSTSRKLGSHFPVSNNRRPILTFPCRHALCSGVRPSASSTLTSQLWSSSSSTISCWPHVTAAWRAASFGKQGLVWSTCPCLIPFVKCWIDVVPVAAAVQMSMWRSSGSSYIFVGGCFLVDRLDGLGLEYVRSLDCNWACRKSFDLGWMWWSFCSIFKTCRAFEWKVLKKKITELYRSYW